MVPPEVAHLITKREFFGYRRPIAAWSHLEDTRATGLLAECCPRNASHDRRDGPQGRGYVPVVTLFN